MGRFVINSLFVLAVLLLFSVLGALTFPTAPSLSGSLVAYGQDLLLILVPVLSISLIGFFLGKGIRGIKSAPQAIALAYISPFMIGSVLALLTVLNFAYSAHINFGWLGGSWYAPWATMFLIGAPLMVAFLV